MTIVIKRLSDTEFDILGIELHDKGTTIDVHVRKEDEGRWTADTFDSSVKNADDAHLYSESYSSLEEALRDILPFSPSEKPSR